MAFQIDFISPLGGGRYTLHVSLADERLHFEGRVEPSETLEVDWSDEFQDLLLRHTRSAEDFRRVGTALVRVHLGAPVLFPLSVG